MDSSMSVGIQRDTCDRGQYAQGPLHVIVHSLIMNFPRPSRADVLCMCVVHTA